MTTTEEEMTTAEEVCAALDDLRPRVQSVESDRDDVYEQRLRVFLAGRACDPPVTNARMAEHAGVTEGAVIQALRKHGIQSEAHDKGLHRSEPSPACLACRDAGRAR